MTSDKDKETDGEVAWRKAQEAIQKRTGSALSLGEDRSEGDRLLRTSTLTGYRASGDGECFCFDARTRAMRDEPFDENGSHAAYRAAAEDAACLVYPCDLLPETGDQRGTWTITVAFTPEKEPGP